MRACLEACHLVWFGTTGTFFLPTLRVNNAWKLGTFSLPTLRVNNAWKRDIRNELSTESLLQGRARVCPCPRLCDRTPCMVAMRVVTPAPTRVLNLTSNVLASRPSWCTRVGRRVRDYTYKNTITHTPHTRHTHARAPTRRAGTHEEEHNASRRIHHNHSAAKRPAARRAYCGMTS